MGQKITKENNTENNMFDFSIQLMNKELDNEKINDNSDITYKDIENMILNAPKKDKWIFIDGRLGDLGKTNINKLIKQYYDCHEYMATLRFINKRPDNKLNINEKRYDDIMYIYIFLSMVV